MLVLQCALESRSPSDFVQKYGQVFVGLRNSFSVLADEIERRKEFKDQQMARLQMEAAKTSKNTFESRLFCS